MTTHETPVAIMYHRGCPDGFGAAWAVWTTRINATYYPVTHEEPLPQLPKETAVYFLDYSPSRDQAEAMQERHGVDNVTVIDHHISGAQELDGVPNCHFDMSKSGAVMAWEEFHPRAQVPDLLCYVQDRDLWTWELPDSKAVNAYLFAVGFDFHRWNKVHKALQRTNARDGLIRTGEIIYKQELRTVRKLASRAQDTTIAGHEVPIVNSATARSEIANLMLQQHQQAPFAVVWYDDREGIRHWSLRSRGDFDVSEIATSMGGGGHAAAASFTTRPGPPPDPVIC